MGTTYRKVNYNEVGNYGGIETKTLYCGYNRSCDVITVYDENGKVILCFDDTLENNLFDVILKLCGNDWEKESEPLTHEEYLNIFGIKFVNNKNL